MSVTKQAHDTLIDLSCTLRGQKFHPVLADPPWRFQNRTGKMAPEHRRLSRYETMTTDEICGNAHRRSNATPSASLSLGTKSTVNNLFFRREAV